MTFFSKSEEETAKIAKDFAKNLRAPAVVAFFGQLGAGKTMFIKAMAEELGVKETVVSPTFAIACEYASKEGKFIHYDMYRLKNDDLYDIGFYDSIKQDAVVVIEWSENIVTYIEKEWYKVAIRTDEDDENTRVIEISE